MSEICVDGFSLTIDNIFDIAYSEDKAIIALDERCQEKVNNARQLVLKLEKGQVPVYGLTRDVGQFKNELLENKINYDKEVLADHSTILGDDCEKYPIEVCKGVIY